MMSSRRKKARSKSSKIILETSLHKELKRSSENDEEKKIASKPSKTRTKGKRIRKSRTTKEYQNTEREVQILLARNHKLSEDEDLGDPLSESVAFFLATDGIVSTPKKAENKLTDTVDEELDEEDGYKEDTDSTTLTDTGPKTNHTSETTYIQIEELAEQLENLSTSSVVTGRRMKLQLNFCDNDLLYKSGNSQKSLRSIPDAEVCSTLIRGMLQRLHVEADEKNLKVSAKTVEGLLSRVDYQECARNALFRTHCSNEAHEFQPIFCDSAVNPIEILRKKLLRVFLRELRFDEHAALMEEHRFANRLDDLYDEYAQRLQRKECEKLEARLITERRVLEQLMLQHPEGSSDVIVNRLAEQSRLVREIRCRLYDEEISSHELLQHLLETWQQLKELRKRQQMQHTRIQLRLQVAAESKTHGLSAQQYCTKRFEQDLGEIYREQLEAYYQAKRLWHMERSTNDGHEMQRKPQKPNLKRLAHELKTKLSRCMEPKVRVIRVNDEAYYAMPATMASAALQNRSFFLKMYCDDEFVGVTRTYRMEPDFRLHINEAIGIVLQSRFPKQLRISLYEKDKLMTAKKLANIFLPLSTFFSAGSSDSKSIQKIAFRSNKYSPLAGCLSLRCECEEEAADASSIASLTIESPKKTKNIDDDGESSPTTITKRDKVNHQTCTLEEDHLQFCRKSSDMQSNERFRLLRKRYFQRNENTAQLHFIPALRCELPEEQLNVLVGKDDPELMQHTLIDPGNWMDIIDVHKHNGKKRLIMLYTALLSQCARLSKMVEHTEQLLINDEPASWGSFFRTLGLIFNPNRPLAQARSDDIRYSAAALNTNSKHNFRLILMVVRGTGIPIRDSQHVALTRDETLSKQRENAGFMIPKLKYSNVRPFIVLSYKDKFCRSTTAEGSDPTWNEQLVLSISGTVNELTDDVKINLYDELIEHQPLNGDDQEGIGRRMDIYQQRIHTNWLGEYRIPIGNLLAVTKLDGVIELQMPQVLLGYKSPVLPGNIDPSEVAGTEQQQQMFPEFRDSVHLWCYLSCEPGAILAPPLRANCLECIESMEVQQHLQQWITMVKELQPLRYQPPLVCITEGKRVCLTRLLQPIPLPPFEQNSNLLEHVCRFVSLLSVIRQQNTGTTSLQGVWLNNRWLLDTGWSSAKDLGVLLCNFLLSIGLQCWLVLGVSSTHGECTYALYQNANSTELGNNHYLWLIEPATGKQYALRDIFCPLIRVHYVVSLTNIYCNIQREMRVSMTSFNLNDTACWLPAFSKRIVAPSGGVQSEHYVYKTLNNTVNLRQHIERKIMKKITAWRTMRKTIWNRAFQPRLQAILEQLEHAATFRNKTMHAKLNYAKQLATEFPSYRFYGFTLNFAYTNLAAISERIKSTGIHLRNEPHVEFTVAVHIHSYPQNVHSIWLFLLATVPAP